MPVTAPSTRTQYIISLRERNPCMTLARIGDIVGVSGERIRQILKTHNVETKAIYRQSRVTCELCGTPTSNRHFCSRACQSKASRVQAVCDCCGKLFEMRKSQLLGRTKAGYKHIFCSQSCRSKYFWQHVKAALEATEMR